MGPTSKGRGREGREGRDEEREGMGEERMGKGKGRGKEGKVEPPLFCSSLCPC